MAAANAGNGAAKTFQYKLVLLGESAVGKSSLVLRFVRGQFFDYQESTIGGSAPPLSCKAFAPSCAPAARAQEHTPGPQPRCSAYQQMGY